MLRCRIATWLVVVPLLVATRSMAASPVDLNEIDRTLRREPTYVGKPKYCLLVFGREARTRVWLVLDGEDLYADLNSNGDLTDAGERFAPQNRRNLGVGGYRDWEYQLGDVVPAGETVKHKRFEITAYQTGDKPLCHVICIWVNDTVQQYAGWGPVFEPSRDAAPIIHFGAPVVCKPLRYESISRTAKAPEIHFCLGTPGIGKHAFAYIGYETLPKEIHPRLQIDWPTRSGDQKRTEAALDGRC